MTQDAIYCLQLTTVWDIQLPFQIIIWSTLFVLLTKRYSADRVTRDEMGGTCGTYGEMRKTQTAIVNKVDVKGLLVRPKRRWEDNSEIDLIVWTGLMWLRIATNFLLHKRRGFFFG